MLDQKSDETFVRAERRAMNADRCLVGVIAVFVNEIQPARLREIDLIGRDGKFATDRAPSLDVNFRPVERGFVWDFDIIDAGPFQDIARHLFSLLPKLRLIDKFLAELRWIVC